MIQRKTICAGLWVMALVTVLALLPLLSTGCGSCQQQPPVPPPAPGQPEKAAMPKAPDAPKPEPAKAAQAPMGAVVPVTLDVLKLAPGSAMVTVALPPLTGLLDKGVALAKRIVPAEVNVDEAVSKAIADTAEDAGAPGAKSLAEIAAAKGLKADAPLAVYIDLAPTAASAKDALAKLKTEVEAQKAAATPPAPKEGDAKKPEGAEPEKPKAEEKANTPAPPDMNKVFESLKEPAIAVVIGCADAAKLDATVKEILQLAGGYVDPEKVENIDVDGVAVHCYDPAKFAYAVVGDKVAASNSLPMLKDVLGRVKTPAVVRYGTSECPASVSDEAVVTMQMDKIAPLIKTLYPDLMAAVPGGAKLTDVQTQSMNRSFDAMAGEDPLVTTLAWTDKKIELQSRYDFAKHPAAATESGEAKPVRLAALLPDTTAVMVCLRFNDKVKEAFKEGWLSSLPQEMQKDEGFAQAMTYVNQIVGMIGDEITIGIAGGVGGMPQLYVLAGLSNPEQTKGLIQMFAPLTPQETYNNVEISLVSVPAPVPFYLAFVGDTLMVGNDSDKLKAVIDLSQSKQTSKFFASLDPAMDVNTPRYGAMLIKTSILTDVIIPMVSMFGGVPPEYQMPIDKTTAVLREIRMTKDLNGSWVESRMTLFLK